MRNFKYAIQVVSILVLFTSCNSAKNNEKLLSVTIEPQRYFLEQIVGDKYKVVSLIPQGANPESFDLAPSQLITVGESQIYFKVGHLGVENSWIDKISRNSPNVKFVDCSEGIAPIDGHLHEHDDGHVHYGGHSGTDPHTWSSPQTARIIVKNMYNAVVQLDDANADYYKMNCDKLLSKIDSTESVMKEYIDKASSKAFIIYHPALSYMAREFGLEQLSIENEGKSPTPSQLKDLIDKANSENIKIVFIQREYDSKNAEVVAKAIDGKTVTLNLMAYDWDKEMIRIAKSLDLSK